MIYTFFILLVGIVLGFQAPIWLNDLFTYLQNRQILKDIIPHEVDENKLCKGSHGWMNARTYSDNGYGTIQVCQVCGFIPSANKMATPEALDRIEENNRIRELEDKIYKDFVAQESKDVQAYFFEEIKNGMSVEKLNHIHSAGMTFNTRYSVYKCARAGEIEKELTRNDA